MVMSKRVLRVLISWIFITYLYFPVFSYSIKIKALQSANIKNANNHNTGEARGVGNKNTELFWRK